MKEGAAPSATGLDPRRSVLAGLAVAILLMAAWLPSNPARPLQPTADATTHLSAARHLVHGEGLKSDVAYPLSFAFDFARVLPQPLVHRQPGFAVLLALPVAAAAGDPFRSIALARGLQAALLGLVAWLGAAALFRRGLAAGVLPWLILIGANPLLVYAVDWIFVEVACGLILLALWLRSRDGSSPGALDGLMAGALTLLRLDLFWLPAAWWLAAGTREGRTRRGLAIALAVWVATLVPWGVRTQALTGRPVFSLQAHAELVKDTRGWPLYTVYQQLEPQPLLGTLARDPVPVLRKAARGVKFFFRDLPRFAPPALLAVFAVGLAGGAWRLRHTGRDRARHDPLVRAAITLLALMVQYAFFDHSLRHLLVVLPVLVWEGAAFLARALPGGKGAWPAVIALVMVTVLPCRLPGWASAAAEAARLGPEVQAQVERFRDDRGPVLFVPHGMVPWILDRPAVWDPGDPAVRAEIVRLLTDRGDNR